MKKTMNDGHPHHRDMLILYTISDYRGLDSRINKACSILGVNNKKIGKNKDMKTADNEKQGRMDVYER